MQSLKIIIKDIFAHPGFKLLNLLVLVLMVAWIGGRISHNSFATAPNPNLLGDINNDNQVDVNDLSLFLSKYVASDLEADFNNSGAVNIFDMSILLSNYGKTYTPPNIGPETTITAYTTAYTFYDNTPPGSAIISNPILHQKAGGVGTYSDPITLAVGHSIIGGKDILDYPAGTKFYIPNLRRYFIVEDTCGDGSTPQNGPCHVGYPASTSTWVDLWIDGSSGSSRQADACASKVTDSNGEAHTIIKNPASNYLVVPGPVFQNGSCSAVYGNTAIKQ